MILKKLSLKNIRSYETASLEFPEGSMLLAGDIGSGKTTLLLAIEYALFGLQPGQRGSALLSNGHDNGAVILEMEINKIPVIVERSLKRSSKSINQDVAALTINGIRMESSVTEIKTKILELLGYPSEFIRKNNMLYRYTVFTPQEEMKQIILEDPEVRLDVLRHIFGIDKYKRMKENLARLTLKLRDDARMLQIETSQTDKKKLVLESNHSIVKLLSARRDSKEQELLKLNLKVQAQEKEIVSLKEFAEEKEKYKREIEKSQLTLMHKREQISQYEKTIQSISVFLEQNDVSFDENLVTLIETEVVKIKKTIDILEQARVEAVSKRASLNLHKSEELSKKQRVFKIEICPTCLQDVPEVHKHNILNATEAKISIIAKEEKTIEEEIIRINGELTKQKQLLTEKEEERTSIRIKKAKLSNLPVYRTNYAEAIKNKELLEKDVSLIESHIVTLKESAIEYSKFENAYKSKQEEHKSMQKNEKTIEIEIAEINKEIQITERDNGRMAEEIALEEKKKEQVIDVLEKEAWLSNNIVNLITFTEKNILLALRKEFTKLFNKWFAMLTTDSFEVYLDESFTPVIIQGDFELDYAFLSGGERTAVALAYRLALNQLINHMLSKLNTREVIILDEPTDGFSEQQLDKVRDILYEMNVRQLLIVSHEPKIEGFVDHVIKVKKEKGKSSVDQKQG